MAEKDAITFKQLFLDDRFIAEMTGLTRYFHQPVKHPDNPVMRADRPWEQDSAFLLSGLVIHDEAEGLFRAWYQAGGGHGPGDGSCMCYATSPDGILWDKPSLAVVEYEGSKDNNIVLKADCMMHLPGVIIDGKDEDPQRRYKAIWWGGQKDASQKEGWLLGRCVAFSGDGIQWTEYPDNPIWVGDGENTVPFGQERHEGTFVLYTSIDGYGMRVVGRTESDDFLHWELPPRLTFHPDAHDPPGTEIGCMSAINYDGVHIGMLYVTRNLPGFSREEWQEILDTNIRQGFFGPPITMNAARCRIYYTELATSADGVNWQRVRRRPYIPYGPEGSWDECIALASRPIVVNDRIHIYYSGQGRIKATPGSDKRQRIADWPLETGLATLRLDGFASLGPGPVEGMGTLVTKDFVLRGTNLCVNADASAGWLKVEILDSNGKPIPGYTRDEARAIRGDELRARATWAQQSDVRRLVGQRLKLRVFLEETHLYSISVLDRAKQ